MKFKSILQSLFVVVCAVWISGCVPVASGVIAYDSAVSHQEHAAYTDYYFSTSPNPVIPEDKWVKEYRLKLEYTQFYHDTIAENAKTNEPNYVLKPIAPFEEWKTNEYQQMLAEFAKSPIHKH